MGIMSDITCLNPAYNKIIGSGLLSKILDKRKLLHDVLLYRSIWNEDTVEILEKVREFYLSPKRGISEKSSLSKDIMNLDTKDYFSSLDFEKNLMENPGFLAYLALGEDIFDYKKHGFSSLRGIIESITSFCISEPQLFDNFPREDYVWRNETYKNIISQNLHGDLHVSQVNVSGKISSEVNLFGEREETFNSYKDDCPKGISAYQDWSDFLVASLKYAEYLGKSKMEEIVNWKDTLEKSGGGVSTNTAEAEFGTDFLDYDIEFLMSYPVAQERVKLQQIPLHIYYDSHENGTRFYPYFSGNKLFYLSAEGRVSSEDFLDISKNKKFSKVLEYSEEDLPHILTANYKYFARDRNRMYKIMDKFNSEH